MHEALIPLAVETGFQLQLRVAPIKWIGRIFAAFTSWIDPAKSVVADQAVRLFLRFKVAPSIASNCVLASTIPPVIPEPEPLPPPILPNIPASPDDPFQPGIEAPLPNPTPTPAPSAPDHRTPGHPVDPSLPNPAIEPQFCWHD